MLLHLLFFCAATLYSCKLLFRATTIRWWRGISCFYWWFKVRPCTRWS